VFEIALKDFRGFKKTNFVQIRPITLLVGENSAGKSSFLAAMKFAFDFSSGNQEPSFNKDPFQLGTFQQISHYRGGRAGRAREFQISIRSSVAAPRRNDRSDREIKDVLLNIRFGNTDSQAVISAVEIWVDGSVIRLTLSDSRIHVQFVAEDGQQHFLPDDIGFPRVVRSEFARYWPILLRDLGFRFRRRDRQAEGLFGEDLDSRISTIADFAQSLAREFSGHVEATSAIRTKPRRTYTPGAETRDGEGSHVPFEMAKLYRAKNKEPWRKLKSSVDEFGKSSQMFRELTIKSFGQNASDPFQIQFSSDGPKTNIVDLGYGTSQILPILYDVSTAPARTRFLIQQPEVHLHPKAQAALGTYFVQSYINSGKNFVLETHSDFIVDRVRMAVAQGFLNARDVCLLFFEREQLENTITHIELDESGAPVNPPNSYRSFFLDEQMRVLGF